MRLRLIRRPRHAAPSILLGALLGLAAAACAAPGPAADSPAGVVRTAVDLAAKKDLAGLKAIACVARQDTIQQLIGLPVGLGAALLPGIDVAKVVDAVRLDASGVNVGDAVISGDEATVPVSGSVNVTFDKTVMKPVIEKLMADRGTPMTSDQLDGLLAGLADYGQAVPIDQQVRVVREGGSWKACPDVPGPGSSIGLPPFLPPAAPSTAP
jgi:hypothetical protein